MRYVLSIVLVFLFTGAARADERPLLIRVFVALCDNENQGIVPVKSSLGKGDDLKGNLYWGALYGVKTFFNKSDHWSLKSCVKKPFGGKNGVLERCIFEDQGYRAKLVADAYRGAEIENAVADFLKAAHEPGGADMIVYVGHNGLMDFPTPKVSPAANKMKKPRAIILACKSREYFAPLLKKSAARPLLMTTGFMAPEAYTLDAALWTWLAGNNDLQVRQAAAEAYARYQKIDLPAAQRLFAGGM